MFKLTSVVSWCFEPSQPQRITSGRSDISSNVNMTHAAAKNERGEGCVDKKSQHHKNVTVVKIKPPPTLVSNHSCRNTPMQLNCV